MIYLISDLHFGHDKYFIYGPRGFSSVEEMNEAIVDRWNSIVTDTDTVYILGDVIMGTIENVKWLTALKGEKIIIQGNHDSIPRLECYLENGIEVKGICNLGYKGYKFLLSHYPTLCSNYDDKASLKSKVINLCGHTHTKDPFSDWDKGTIYHVDCDAHNCTPVSIEKVIEDIKIKARQGE